MRQTKTNKIAKRLAMMAILLTGLYLTGVDQTMAQRTNLALGKKASQSSDIGTPFRAGEGTADLAVDGNTDGDWSKGSVTSTACNIDSTNECQGSNQPYWIVDLGAVYDIDEIQIWNRTDCCQERLSNFKIIVTSDLKIPQSTANPSEEFEPGVHNASDAKYQGKNPMTFRDRKRGRYVTIQILNTNAFLSLAEVQVYGSLPNVAQQTVEDQYWNSVKNSSNAEDFKSYLREYPNGKYATIASQNINNSNAGNSGNSTVASFPVDCIKINDNLWSAEEKNSTKNRDCWVEKARSGSLELEYANLQRSVVLTQQNLLGVNLSGADLSGAVLQQSDLTGANLSGALLENARITNSDLSYARLDGANLKFANLVGVNFTWASLISAKLNGANLNGTKFINANLYDADLRHAIDLRLANLTGAKMQMAHLTYQYLANVNLSGATLSEANLGEADLSNAVLSNADLSKAVFRLTDLSGANLSGANLSGANLYMGKLNNANLSGADLSGALLLRGNLDNANLSGAILIKATLEDSSLRGAVLIKADLSGANCKAAYFYDAKLRNANLREVDFAYAGLARADFSNADFSNANLTEANLAAANLTGANLTRANLTTADLVAAKLNNANLTNADLRWADLRWANLTKATVSRKNTRGVDFDDWIKRGGIVVD